jgi:hypothetical protein
MTTPQIATILEDGTYGQRDMTQEEIAEHEAIIADIQPLPSVE